MTTMYNLTITVDHGACSTLSEPVEGMIHIANTLKCWVKSNINDVELSIGPGADIDGTVKCLIHCIDRKFPYLLCTVDGNFPFPDK